MMESIRNWDEFEQWMRMRHPALQQEWLKRKPQMTCGLFENARLRFTTKRDNADVSAERERRILESWVR